MADLDQIVVLCAFIVLLALKEGRMRRGPAVVSAAIGTSIRTTSVASGIRDPADATVVRGSRRFWIDGSVVLRGTAVTDAHTLESALPEAAGDWTPDQIAHWWSTSVRDIGALYIQDAVEGWSACLPDPLGGAVLYTWSQDALFCASTDLLSLREVLRGRGVALRPSPMFQAERMLFGNGGLTPAPFDGVRVLPVFHYVVASEGRGDIVSYGLEESLGELSLHELFDMVIQDVTGSLAAVVSATADLRVAHITGGFDSRLVLAAASRIGVLGDLRFFCSGPEGSNDRVIADGLTHALTLRRISTAGLAPAPTRSMAERLLGPLFASGGVLSTGPLGRERRVPVIAVGGGYGEVLRSFYGARGLNTPKSWASDPEQVRRAFVTSTRAPLHPDVKDALVGELCDRLDRLSDRYGGDAAPDAYYTHGRNRYHIGQGSMAWGRVGSRFDPLYSPAGFVLSMRLAQPARKANVLGYDLMEHLHRELLAYPFDRDRFSSELLQMRTRPPQLTWGDGGAITTEEAPPTSAYYETSPALEALAALGLPPDTPSSGAQRARNLERANRMGANFWQIDSLDAAQAMLRRAIAQMDFDSAFHGVMDLERIAEIADSSSLTLPEVRMVYDILGGIVWIGAHS